MKKRMAKRNHVIGIWFQRFSNGYEFITSYTRDGKKICIRCADDIKTWIIEHYEPRDNKSKEVQMALINKKIKGDKLFFTDKRVL